MISLLSNEARPEPTLGRNRALTGKWLIADSSETSLPQTNPTRKPSAALQREGEPVKKRTERGYVTGSGINTSQPICDGMAPAFMGFLNSMSYGGKGAFAQDSPAFMGLKMSKDLGWAWNPPPNQMKLRQKKKTTRARINHAQRKELRRFKNALVKRVNALTGFTTNNPVAMCCRSLGRSFPSKKNLIAHIEILEDFIKSRGGNLKVPMKSSDFYRSDQWRQLRYRVIQKNGGTCMACKATDKPIHVDHIKPRSLYPELELDEDNLQILCEDCNLGKLHLDETDWRSLT